MDTSGTKQKIIIYFKKNLKKGYTEDSLRWALYRQGYSKVMIEEAIKDVNNELAHKAPVLKEKPKIVYQVIDEHDRPIKVKRSWWRDIFT